VPKKLPVRPLTDKDREGLRQLQRGARSVTEFCRARAVALQSGGWSVGDIADAVDVTDAAVYGWLKRFSEGGVESLRDRGRSGRPPTYDERFRARICRALSKSPRRCGLATTVWTVLTLAVYLFDATSRMISRSHLRRIIHDEGYVWRRPKLSLKWRQNRRLYRAVERRLRQLEREATKPGSRSVLIYGDECEFHLNPGLVGMWTRRGVQPEVPSAGQDLKISAFGGINFATGRMTWHLAKRKNQTEFLEFLRELLSRYRGWKVTLVLDNVAYHKTQKVRALLEENADRIEVVWLPPYSPTLNRIERVWKHLKSRYLYNEFFGTEMGLLRAVERALNTLNDDLDLARGIVLEKHRLKRTG
jgi:transposase